MYQKQVSSLKNDSKSKGLKYLVNIFFQLSKQYLISQNHWCVIIDDESIASFVSQAKMQWRQVYENQNGFEINLGVTLSCEVTICLYEVRDQSGGMCDL